MLHDIQLHEWRGIVLASPPGTVLDAIKRERERTGQFTLWKYQHVRHHEHPSLQDIEGKEMENVLEQNEARRYLIDRLSTNFPKLPFVVQTSWLYFTTWYQATPDAPAEDGDEWCPRKSTISSESVCAICRQQLWSEPFELDDFRGIRWIRCLNCGTNSVESTKTICDRIGPDLPFVVPHF